MDLENLGKISKNPSKIRLSQIFWTKFKTLYLQGLQRVVAGGGSVTLSICSTVTLVVQYQFWIVYKIMMIFA